MAAQVNLSYSSKSNQNDVKLIFKSTIPGWEQVDFEGNFEQPKSPKDAKYSLKSRLRWPNYNNIKFKMELDLNEQNRIFNVMLSSSLFETQKFSSNIDLRKNTKINMLYSYGKTNHRAKITVISPLQWSASFNLAKPKDYQAIYLKFELESANKLILVHSNTKQFPFKFKIATSSPKNRQMLTALLSIPAVGIPEWRLNAEINEGKTAILSVFWAPRSSISLNLSSMPSELSAKLRTPFSSLKTLDISCKYDLSKQEIGLLVNFNSKTITMDAFMPDATSVSVLIKTPFKDYKEIKIDASFAFDESFVFSLNGSNNGKKMSAEASFALGSDPICDSFNTSIVIETPFDFLRRAKLSAAYNEEYKNGRLSQHVEGNAEYNEFGVRYPNTLAYVFIHHYEEPMFDDKVLSPFFLKLIQSIICRVMCNSKMD